MIFITGMPFFYFHPWKWIFSNAHDNSDRVWIKGITITNLILLCWWYKTLCKTRINTHEFHLYCWNHVCKLNKQRLVDCFHQKFRCYTQITVHNYCIAICRVSPLSKTFNGPLDQFFVTKNSKAFQIQVFKLICI